MKFTTSISRVQKNKEIIRGHNLVELIKDKSFVETIFLIFQEKFPNEKEIKMINALLVACLDHGVGAPSTTTARISASARNDVRTALTVGLLTLGGRHGLAAEEAAVFFQEHKNTEDIGTLVKTLRDQHVRIPGFGHRILTVDERARTLLSLAEECGVYGPCCRVAQEIEQELNNTSSKPLPLNIDGALAAILSDMGFASGLVNSFFIIGRVPGILAHAHEELHSGEGLKRIIEEE